jgi:hypothetical protein
MISLGVVIPALDEAERLPPLLAALESGLEAHDTVVVVDNGSSDATVDILRDLATDRSWLTVLHEDRRGPGWARGRGAAHLLTNWSGDFDDCWMLSCDADAKPGRGHLDTWRRHLERSDADLVTGSYRFAEQDLAAVRDARTSFHTFGETVRVCEDYVGVVNPTGTNHAVRASSYVRIGGYQQPRSTRVSGRSCLVAGDDWDLGVRTRLAGLAVERIDHRMVVSARRFLADPAGYLTGAAHDGPFERVETAGKPPPVPDLAKVTRATTARAVLHFLLKPLLLGIGGVSPVIELCAHLDPGVGDAVVSAMGAGRRLWAADRDSFIYDLLRAQEPLADVVARAFLANPSFGIAAAAVQPVKPGS